MPELNYKLTGENTELIKGESSQKAIENQSPKGNVVNTITVDEVKELDKKADSKQDADFEALKARVAALESGSNTKATVHEFDEGTVLTDAILSKVKSGDIVKVLQMEFVVNNKVNQSPRSITGSMVGSFTDDLIILVKLNWVKGEELEPTMKTFTFASPEPVEEISEE